MLTAASLVSEVNNFSDICSFLMFLCPSVMGLTVDCLKNK